MIAMSLLRPTIILPLNSSSMTRREVASHAQRYDVSKGILKIAEVPRRPCFFRYLETPFTQPCQLDCWLPLIIILSVSRNLSSAFGPEACVAYAICSMIILSAIRISQSLQTLSSVNILLVSEACMMCVVWLIWPVVLTVSQNLSGYDPRFTPVLPWSGFE